MTTVQQLYEILDNALRLAIEHIERSLEIAERDGDPDDVWVCRHDRAQIEVALGELTLAWLNPPPVEQKQE